MTVPEQPCQHPFGAPRRIPCLDGLRALAVILVVLEHGRLEGPEGGFPALAWFPFDGRTGVALFFVLSGFLITSLLLDERERAGRISLWRFYLRRAVRILPPFYLYLAMAILLGELADEPIAAGELLASGAFCRNLYAGSESWLLSHTWSLSVEEQSYLLWPLALAFLPPRRAAWLGCVLILVWPVVRGWRHGDLALAGGESALRVAALDSILYGCLLALLARREPAVALLRKLASRQWVLVVPALLWTVHALAPAWPAALFAMLPALRNLCLVWLLWWCLNNAGHPIGRVLESRPVVLLGLISYSLYLWQPPFFWDPSLWICRFPQNVAGLLVTASLSYLLVERPVNRLRSRWR